MSARRKNGTILEQARRGETPQAVLAAARREGVDPEVVRAGIAAGTIVLCRPGTGRGARHLAVGAGLAVKVNANLGTSQARSGLKGELEKLAVAVEAGADAVMDLSTGGDLDLIRAARVEMGGLVKYHAQHALHQGHEQVLIGSRQGDKSAFPSRACARTWGTTESR